MSIYALSDLHLSLGNSKPMDIFGDEWKDHHLKIEKNWNSIVKNDDYVIIGGDISWAMSSKDAEPDMDFIKSLNGKKLLLRGNHDYWWDSVSKIRSRFKELSFIQNDVFEIDDIAVCGSRGWKNPNDEGFKEDDRKTYERELIRYKLSLDTAVRKGFKNILFVSHYPQVGPNGESTGFSELLEKYNVKRAIYGHIHGKENFKNIFEGEKNGIVYSLTSADYLDFMPKKIFDSEEKKWLL